MPRFTSNTTLPTSSFSKEYRRVHNHFTFFSIYIFESEKVVKKRRKRRVVYQICTDLHFELWSGCSGYNISSQFSSVTVVDRLISTKLLIRSKTTKSKTKKKSKLRVSLRLMVITPIRVGMIISSSVGHKLDRVFPVQVE